MHGGRLRSFGIPYRSCKPPDAAELFIEKSRMIGHSLALGLAVSRGELPPLHTPRPG